jgi:hypothetical protein
MSIAPSRRAAILGAAAFPMIRVVKSQSRPKFIAISSANRNNGGVNACAKAVEVMRAGGDTLDAVIAGVDIAEPDPDDNSVGYGGLTNSIVDHAYNTPHGAINCIGMDQKGEISAVTATSGMTSKIPGRCGDSPIIGGCLWLDQDLGDAGSTGRGEENLRVAGDYTIVENMRHGMSPKDAALDCLKRVACNFDNDEKRLAQVELSFYVLRILRRVIWKSDAPSFAVCTGGMPAQNAPCTSWNARPDIREGNLKKR